MFGRKSFFLTLLFLWVALGACTSFVRAEEANAPTNLLKPTHFPESWDYVQPWADKENRPVLSDGSDHLVVRVGRVVGLPWSMGQTVNLHEGKVYTVHLRARSADSTSHTVVLDTTQVLPVGYQNCGLYQPLRLQTHWKTFSVAFTAKNTGSGKCAIGFWTGSQWGVFEIADVTLSEGKRADTREAVPEVPPHTNLLLPPSEVGSWIVHADHWDYAYRFESENRILRVEVLGVPESKNQEGLQLCQMGGGTLQQGRTYTLRFMARADKPRSVGVTVTTNTAEAVSPVGLRETAQVGTAWQMFRYTFVAPQTSESLRLPCFLIGDAKGTLWLANITLEDEPK